jgi:hypothetical protein
MSEMMKTFVSDTILALGIVLGLFLVWIGALIWGFSGDPDVKNIGMLFRSFGILILSGGLLLGGLLRHDMDKWIRWMLILSATLILIFIGFWTGFWSVLGLDFSGLGNLFP